MGILNSRSVLPRVELSGGKSLDPVKERVSVVVLASWLGGVAT